jgi:hypothetical protein
MLSPDRSDFQTAARRALFGKDRLSPLPKQAQGGEEKNTVRSVQRLPNLKTHHYMLSIY